MPRSTRSRFPCLHFFTGTHKDYHRPSDTADKINVPDMRRVAQYVADVAVALAEAEKPPRVHRVESLSRLTQPAPQADRPYFGSIPDFGREQPGYAISGVTKAARPSGAG